MKHPEIDRYAIETQFVEQTGISRDLICELTESFPVSPICHVLLLDREFQFTLTADGKRIKKGSIIEIK